MHWIQRSVDLPLPPAVAFPLTVEPGTIDRWLVQVREVRPRGFLHFRPRVRHGGIALVLDVRVRRAIVPELLEVEVDWRAVTARVVLELEATGDGGSRATMRIGLDLPLSLRIARRGIAAELSRMMAADLRRLRRLAREQAGEAVAVEPDEEDDEVGAEPPAEEWDDVDGPDPDPDPDPLR
ncbi:SRPBCC family protein [Patulibacter defluvii]|uniref:SRPBCC family protein n=1 Tax=Patulibacter defluvii TaxID=3095358 RepID=UPI002A764D30|nr:SRPBCC family protein [Patulibacter sp. DM4]